MFVLLASVTIVTFQRRLFYVVLPKFGGPLQIAAVSIAIRFGTKEAVHKAEPKIFPPTHLHLLPKAAAHQMETPCYERSVWAVARPLPNPAPHLHSSSFAFPPLWALLVSQLSKEQLRQALSDPTTASTDLGNLWEVNDKLNSAEVINQPAFSLSKHAELPICLEYCGATHMLDSEIRTEGTQR